VNPHLVEIRSVGQVSLEFWSLQIWVLFWFSS
jgi:hypothetical protein